MGRIRGDGVNAAAPGLRYRAPEGAAAKAEEDRFPTLVGRESSGAKFEIGAFGSG